MKNKRRKAKRAAEIGTATIIVLGLGAAVAGVALYNHFKAPTTPSPPPAGNLPPGNQVVLQDQRAIP